MRKADIKVGEIYTYNDNPEWLVKVTGEPRYQAGDGWVVNGRTGSLNVGAFLTRFLSPIPSQEGLAR